MEKRIGVYVCECGPNIANAMFIDQVIEAISGMDGVVVIDKNKLLCSPNGKKFLAEQIQEHRLTHLVLAACSPKQHESTFMAICQDNEMNPYLLQMANIREHVAWITPDKEKATERAIRHIKAAIRRVQYHTPLNKKEVVCKPDVLVIGGGMAGISTSLLLGSPGRKVYLAEKDATLGGKISRYEKLFPGMIKSTSIAETHIRNVEANEHIEVLTETEIKKVLGFFGNFVITICPKHSPSESRELTVGAIVVASGINLFNPEQLSEYGYGRIQEVYTAFELEEMNLNGQIVMKNGQEPKRVGIIHCVGRDEKGYCSRICCLAGMKIARYIREKIPESSVTAFYQDLCVPGSSSQSFYEETKANETEYIRTDAVELSEANGIVKIAYRQENEKYEEKLVDMAVLLPAIVPATDATELSKMLNVSLDSKGFFIEEHEKLNPVGTSIEGIYLAGCASGPKSLPETISQSEAVAGKILSTLIPGRKLETEAKTSKIFENLCVGCQTCLTVCCYSAISYDELKGICTVNDVLCKGCGNCAAACPSGAASHQHFTPRQIYQEIVEILK